MNTNIIKVHRMSPDFNVGFIWNSEDVKKLRLQYRIVGTLIGCIPSIPFQENIKGLPLMLSPEEISLLNNLGVIKLATYKSLSDKPSIEWRQARFKNDAKLLQIQAEQKYERCKEHMYKNIDKIINGKKTSTSEIGKQGIPLDKEIIIQHELFRIKSAEDITSSVFLHRSEPNLNLCEEIELKWEFPSNENEKLRFETFCHLWKKGYYLTSGLKFGGDFLSYPGDPLKYHSFYVVICVNNNECNSLQLIEAGRLGTQVRKNILLCTYVDQKFCMYTLKWNSYLQ